PFAETDILRAQSVLSKNMDAIDRLNARTFSPEEARRQGEELQRTLARMNMSYDDLRTLMDASIAPAVKQNISVQSPIVRAAPAGQPRRRTPMPAAELDDEPSTDDSGTGNPS